MRPGKHRRPSEPDLGDSWVVEADDSDGTYSDQDNPPPQKNSLRRSTRGTKSPEPQLRMPPLDPETLEASTSWGESSSRSPRYPREPRANLREGELESEGPSRKVRSRRIAAQQEHTPRTARRVEKQPSQVQDILASVAGRGGSVAGHAFDVFTTSLRILKTPLAYLLAIWLLFGLGVMIRNFATHTLYTSLSPICRIPGVSFMELPFCPLGEKAGHDPAPNIEFDQLMAVQAKFDEVLEQSAGHAALPIDMKRSESSIRDLRQLVRFSHIASKNELVHEFDGFLETARKVSFDLQKFNNHVGRAVDSVISTTRWTGRVLDDMQGREANRGIVVAFVNDKVLAPFKSAKFSERVLLDQYIQHTRIIEEELYKLISEAQALLGTLTYLDDKLDVIHSITARENTQVTARKDEVLSQLWSLVGGNSKELKSMDRQLRMLKHVDVYRKNALAHISGTLLRLQAIGAGLEDLRERVATPELLRDHHEIPLSVHIENIQLGVDRLEEGRKNARVAGDEQVRKTLQRGKLDGVLIEG